jgi:hypothetical protein
LQSALSLVKDYCFSQNHIVLPVKTSMLLVKTLCLLP